MCVARVCAGCNPDQPQYFERNNKDVYAKWKSTQSIFYQVASVESVTSGIYVKLTDGAVRNITQFSEVKIVETAATVTGVPSLGDEIVCKIAPGRVNSGVMILGRVAKVLGDGTIETEGVKKFVCARDDSLKLVTSSSCDKGNLRRW